MNFKKFIFLPIGILLISIGFFTAYGIDQLLNREVVFERFVLGKVDREPFRFEGEFTQEEPVNKDFSIFAPQINVNAPVFANVDGGDENAYLANVLRGVAHYKNKKFKNVVVDGAFPGQKGNIFLFGHSQIPGGDLSNYQGVFNNLEELMPGDIVKIYYQEQEYQYEVMNGQVVDKDAVEYLESTETETLTLMSCWPLGLDWKRYVVRAKRID